MSSSSRSDAELQRRVRQQETLADLGRRALDSDELDRVMGDAVTAISETLDTDYCEVFELGSDGERLTLREGAGWPEEDVDSVTIPAGNDSQTGYTLQTERPVVVEELSAEERFDGADPLVERGVVSGITVTVGPSADPWGVLGTHATDRREFSDGDATFVRNVANVVGSVVERAEARSQLEEVYGRVTEQEQRLSTLMSNVPGMVYRCRNERGWPMEFVSEGCRDLTGYDPAALERGDVSFGADVVVDADRDELWEEIQDGLAEDGQYLVTYRIETADGETRWVRERGRRAEGPDDNTGLEGVVIDVTEEVRAERQLAEERDMFAEGPAIVFRWRDEEGWPVEYVSENVADILGYEPSALESGEVPYTDLLLDEEIDRIAAEVEAHSDGTTDRFSHEPYRVRTSDGDVRWVKDTTKIVRDDSGEVDHYLGYLVDITERKERERELRRYETIVETIDDGIYVKDEDGEFTMVNDAYAEMLGYEPEELVGEHASLVVDEEVIERARREETADRDEQVDGPALEAEMETADGDRLPAEATFATLETDDGERQRVGVVRDVSERKEREEELRRYEAIFQAVNDGLYVVDEDGQFTMVNDAYAEMLGYEPAELIGEHVSLVVDEAVRDRATTEEAAMREGAAEMASIEAEMKTADGERIPAEATFAMLPTPGEGQRRVGVVRDISDRKERERELQRYERLVENLPVGVYRNTPEPDGEFVEMNEALAQIFDADSREELMEVPVRDLYPDPSVREELSERLRQEGIVKDFELRQVTLDGRDIWISVTGIKTEEDGEVYFDGVVQDVTDRKERERELQETERRFEAVFEDPNILVGLLEPDGTVVDINETAMEYIDADLADVRGDLFWETPWWGMGDDVQADVREWTERAAAGEYVDFEADLTRPNGDRYVLSGYFRPVTDEDGNVVSIIVSDRDVTERREYERRLAESERQLSTLMENVPGMVFQCRNEPGWPMEFVSDACRDITGYDPADLEQGIISYGEDIVVDEDRERVREEIQEAVDEEDPFFSVTYRIRTLDGERRWVRSYGRGSFDADGRLVDLEGIAADVTERKQLETELRESEQRYRTLAEYFPNGIVTLFDEDLEYTLAAGQGFDRIPVEPDDLEGKRLYDVWPEETTEALEPAFQAALDGREKAVELEYEGRDWVLRGVPISDERGDVFAGMTMAQDITERKERERRLARYKEYTDDILDAIDDVFYLIDRDGGLQRWNESINAITGYSDAELEGMHATEFFDDEDAQAVAEALAKGFETGTANIEAEILTKSGEHVPFEFSASTLEDPDGNAVLAGIGRDVTERRERERALRESERRYRTLAEHFPNGAVGVYDHDLEYTLAAGAKMGSELPPADVLEGSRLPDIFPEHTVADLEPVFRAAIEEGETGKTTTEFGGRYWRVWATPLRNVDGEIFAGLSFAQDITERREYEQMLEESNERLEQFAYAASHDLQEPLRMVSSYLQLIERRYEDELDEEGREFIAYAVDGADRMREMIDGLLQYSRVETRGDPFEPVDLDEVVAEAREDLGMKIAETDADISVGALPQVEGDPGQLRQVFQNLLDNAIEYSGEGRPRVEVSAERAGDWWEISVSDDGIGIDPDDADRAFEVFQSLHDRSSYDGTGIGLALCERVVERHGGDIWVDSHPGEGATFSFTLPAAEDENE